MHTERNRNHVTFNDVAVVVGVHHVVVCCYFCRHFPILLHIDGSLSFVWLWLPYFTHMATDMETVVYVGGTAVGLLVLMLLVDTVMRAVVRVVVPQGNVSVLEYFGRFDSILEPGLHVKLWPGYALRHIKWTTDYVRTGSNNTGYHGTLIPTSSFMFDIPEVEASTCDHQKCYVDTDIKLRVTDVKTAVYEGDGTLASVMTAVSIAIKNAVGHMTYNEIIGSYRLLSTAVMNELKDLEATTGISVETLVIETVACDEHVEAAAQEATAAGRAADAQLQRCSMEKQLAEQRQLLERAEHKHKLEMETEEHKARVKREDYEAKQELERERQRVTTEATTITTLLTAGATSAYLQGRQWATAMMALAKSPNTKLIIPGSSFSQMVPIASANTLMGTGGEEQQE